jgi:hypothetical protein
MRIFFTLFALSVGALTFTTASATDLETSNIKCSEAGANFSRLFKKEYSSEISMWGNPEFYYSKRLATCLVYTEVIDGLFDKEINAVWYYRRITDIYSNKVLAYSRYRVAKNDLTKKEIMVNLSNVSDAANLTSKEFDTTKNTLLKQ